MKYINLHTHHVSNANEELSIYNLDLNKNIVDKYFSAGIHPWFIQENNLNAQFCWVEKHLSNKKCLALGECGLDKNINIDVKLQKQIFLKQLEVNKSFNKPVIIHCVKSFQEIIFIRKAYNFPFIIHGFNKKIELAQQLIKNNFLLSFGVVLLENVRLQEVFKAIPIENIFLETDNSDISIQKVYKKAADLKKINIEELILLLQKNFKREFNE